MSTNTTVDPAQQTRQVTPESGLRYDRIQFVRELEAGRTPPDPNWRRYSDLIMEVDGDPDPGKEPVQGVGTADPVYFGRGIEENELTVTYALQKAMVDINDAPNDAAADAFLRNTAWQTPNTHSFIARHNNPTPGKDDPAGCSGQRMYFIGRGGKCNVSMEPDAEDEEPVPVELEYSFERIRPFHIYQPATPSTVVITSTDPRDTNINVTIESEYDPGTDTVPFSETLALNGTTLVPGSVPFPDIDAIQLSEPTYGDVIVSINTGTNLAPTAGGQISKLLGADSRSQDTAVSRADGDYGIPAAGAGSFEGTVGLPYEDIQDDSFTFDTFPADVTPPEFYNITLEADNDFENSPRQGTNSPQINEANRGIEIGASVIGERASHDILRAAYTSEGGTITWEMSRTRFIMPDSEVIEPPGPGAESDQAFVEVEGTWQSRGIIIENTTV